MRRRRGRFLGLPYDWRRPTRDRIRRGIWDAHERRVLLPKTWGWGYGINLAAVWRRLTRPRR